MSLPLKWLPLGGLGEVGKNMMMFEYDKNIIVIDSGLMFPASDMHGIDYVIPDYWAKRPKPCMGGWGTTVLNVTPQGKVMPCHAAASIPGLRFASVREQDLRTIWQESQPFQTFRGTDWLPEPCGSCAEKEKDFGGCRCQAFLLTGDAANTDPACSRSPHHHLVQQAVAGVVAPLRFRKPLVKRAAGAVSTAFMED